MEIKSHSSGVLFRTAIQAYERIDSIDRGQNDSVVAILMSAAALEAYINELGDKCSYFISSKELYNPILGQLAYILSELENTKESTRLKIKFIKYTLTNKSIDKANQLYEDMELLFRIRNAIIHLKPSNDMKKDKIIKSLETKKIIEKIKDKPIMSWLSNISTKSVAKWAINTVVDLVEDIKVNITNSEINIHIKSMLLSNFSKVE